MDFIRYDKNVFYDHIAFDKGTKEYIKLDTIMRYLKETYSCFNPNLRHEIYTKKILKKPEIIKLNKDIHSSKRIMISCLNKLTISNYKTIYKKIMLSIQVHDANDFINMIVQTCINSKSYHQLYVGLIFHIYDLGSAEIRSIIFNQINEHFTVLFDRQFYLINSNDDVESYDEFCDRLTTKNKTIVTVQVYMMLNLHNDLSMQLYNKPQCLINFIYTQLESQSDLKSVELILSCLTECYTINHDLIIPSLKTNFAWKKLISIDTHLNNLLHNLVFDCKFPKIRFMILDLLDILDKHFALET